MLNSVSSSPTCLCLTCCWCRVCPISFPYICIKNDGDIFSSDWFRDGFVCRGLCTVCVQWRALSQTSGLLQVHDPPWTCDLNKLILWAEAGTCADIIIYVNREHWQRAHQQQREHARRATSLTQTSSGTGGCTGLIVPVSGIGPEGDTDKWCNSAPPSKHI